MSFLSPMMSSWRTRVPFVGCLMLTLAIGYAAGRLTSIGSANTGLGLVVQPDNRAAAATVRLDRIESGKLVGSAAGSVRLVLGDTPVTLGSGAFRVPAGPLLVEVIPIAVPPGMRFVASKKGTRYYAVDSANGQNIVPQNRVYFRTAEEAVGAGYR